MKLVPLLPESKLTPSKVEIKIRYRHYSYEIILWPPQDILEHLSKAQQRFDHLLIT